MILPNFENTQIVDNKGYLTPAWQIIMQAFFQTLQKNLSDEGFLIPQQDTATITDLQTQFNASPTPTAYFGDLLYDSSTDEFKVNIAGTFRVVQVV